MDGLHLNLEQPPPAVWLSNESGAEGASRLDLDLGSGIQPNPERQGAAVSAELRDAMLATIPNLRAFAISLTHNRDQADDLVQDTILRAWSNIGQFQAGTSIRAWLFTILRNSYLNQWRRERRHVEDPDGSFAGRLWTPPEQHGRCDVQDMLNALQKLSTDQREALLLVVAEGMAYEDAAQVCGVAIGTIRSRVNRARARLAQLLAIKDAGDLGPDRVTQAALQNAA